MNLPSARDHTAAASAFCCVGPFTHYMWPPPVSRINEILLTCFSRVPVQRRARIKWLRRKRRIIYQCIALAQMTVRDFRHILVDVQPMSVPAPSVLYSDFMYGVTVPHPK